MSERSTQTRDGGDADVPPTPKGTPRPTFLHSEQTVARLVLRPIAHFLHVEAAGGIVLVLATLVALVWANSAWADAYHSLWETEVGIEVGDWALVEDLHHWVNDGLMTLFFFVVGLEIKREITVGALRSRRAAAMPALAAVGGMVVPALVYLALNAGDPDTARGWGIPMATDIAFALGVLSLLGRRVPSSLKVFLLSLAIVDDIGAILVIAAFYTAEVHLGALAVAVALFAVMAVMRSLRVWYIPLYVVVGVGVWLATLESGIHATIAGVAMGMLAPARPLQPPGVTEALARQASARPTPAALRRAAFLVRESVPITDRLEHHLHPWTSYVVIPLFALANAGVELDPGSLGDAASSSVALGIVAGLVIGKVAGITAFTWFATRLGLGPLPIGARWPHMVGVAMVAGIGFTVSLFITDLAFDDADVQATAKVGILAASALAAVLGALLLRLAGGGGAGGARGVRDGGRDRGREGRGAPAPAANLSSR